MTVEVDRTIDMKTPPKTQVDTMPAGRYFAYAAELIKVNPPHITDQPMIAQLKKIGFEAGRALTSRRPIPLFKRHSCRLGKTRRSLWRGRYRRWHAW